MAVPTPEEFRTLNQLRNKKLKEENDKIDKQFFSTLHRFTPYILIIIEQMKAEAPYGDIELRKVVDALHANGLRLPGRDIFAKVHQIVEDDLGFKLALTYPTQYQMPETLPVITDNEVRSKAIYKTPTFQPGEHQ